VVQFGVLEITREIVEQCNSMTWGGERRGTAELSCRVVSGRVAEIHRRFCDINATLPP
jgi:hypothetical protein